MSIEQTVDIKLKPCPWCGPNESFPPVLTKSGRHYRVECSHCGAKTTGSGEEVIAINIWNDRGEGTHQPVDCAGGMIAVDTLKEPRKHLYEAMCWAVAEKDRQAQILMGMEPSESQIAVAYRKANISTLNYILGFLHSHPLNSPKRESGERKPPELFSDEENKDILQRAEWLWEDLQKNDLGGYSGINRPFYILWKFKEVIEKFGKRDVGLNWSKDALDALPKSNRIEDQEPR